MNRRHPFRPLVGFVLAGLVGALAFTSAGVAKETPAAIGGTDAIKASYYTPRGLSSGPVNVMVQLPARQSPRSWRSKARSRPTKAGHQGRSQRPAGRDQACDQDPRRPSARRLPGGLQRNQGSHRCEPDGQAGGASGVIGVHLIPNHERDNAVSVPYLGVPTTWSAPNFIRGLNKKIAIIDTGVDFTHGNFRAPGTVATPAEYAAANATDTLPANPAFFGPGA